VSRVEGPAPISTVIGDARPRSRPDSVPLNHNVIGRSARSVPQETGKPVPWQMRR
jgi:hypothetical protein